MILNVEKNEFADRTDKFCRFVSLHDRPSQRVISISYDPYEPEVKSLLVKTGFEERFFISERTKSQYSCLRIESIKYDEIFNTIWNYQSQKVMRTGIRVIIPEVNIRELIELKLNPLPDFLKPSMEY